MKNKHVLCAIGFLALIQLFSLITVPVLSAAPYPISNTYVSADQIIGPSYGYDYTNNSGQYKIDQGIEEPGVYQVLASPEGYLRQTVDVTIDSVNDTKTADIYLNRSAIIWGKVLGYDALPAVDADVILRRNETGQYIDQVTTDSNGMYIFASYIETGAYYIEVSLNYDSGSDNLVLPARNYGLIGGRSGFEGIAAMAGQSIQAPDLILNASAIIRGTVKDEFGDPIPNANIYASGPFFTYFSMLTDASGVYKFSYEVMNGTYDISVNAYGYLPNEAIANATPLATTTQDFTLTRSAGLSGYIHRNSDSRQVPDVLVQVYTEDYMYGSSAHTDSDGFYEMRTGLGTGNYTVIVRMGSDVLNETSIMLATGQNTTLDLGINVYFIVGTVYENATVAGQEVASASVELVLEGDFFGPPGGSAYTGNNGSYAMTVPVREGYGGMLWNATFTVSKYGYNDTVLNDIITIGTDAAYDFVIFKAPPEPPPPPSATIMGTVYGGDGPSLPFSYKVWNFTDQQYNFLVAVNASSSMEYAFTDIMDGYLYVYVWGPEGTTGQMTAQLPKAIYPGPTFTVTSTLSANPTIIDLTQNATYWFLTIEYGHSSGYIEIQSENTVPEFPTLISLVAMLTLIAAITYAVKKRKIPT